MLQHLGLQTLRRWQIQKKPKTYIFAALWLGGLALMFLAPAPVKLTDEALDKYEAILTEAEAYSRKHQPAVTVRFSKQLHCVVHGTLNIVSKAPWSNQHAPL